MKPGIEKHPAYVWGRMVREKRVAKRFTLRDFHDLIGCDLCQYSEIEHGIIRWLTPEIENEISERLFLNKAENDAYWAALAKAKKAKKKLMCLGDIFEFVEVLPAWPRMRKDGRRQTPEEMLEMARFVLLPLK